MCVCVFLFMEQVNGCLTNGRVMDFKQPARTVFRMGLGQCLERARVGKG